MGARSGGILRVCPGALLWVPGCARKVPAIHPEWVGRPPPLLPQHPHTPSKEQTCSRPSRCILTETTLNNGYLGSRNDEERSEMRYVV